MVQENMQEVVIVLIRDEVGRILTLKRAKGKDDGVIWGFPSGKVEAGETQEDAVAREVYEETGILCKPLKIIAERTVENNKLIYWTAQFLQGTPCDPVTQETSEVAFRTIDEILRVISINIIHPSVRRELGIQNIGERSAQALEIK